MSVTLSSNDLTVLRALDDFARPLSAYDILNTARSTHLKAPVQVYRSLSRLIGRGLVHRIETLNAFVACTEHAGACAGDDHRHAPHSPGFIVCRRCHMAREFDHGELVETASDLAGPGFSVDLVTLEVLGICGDCNRADAGKRPS